jgi:hypothetical protein
MYPRFFYGTFLDKSEAENHVAIVNSLYGKCKNGIELKKKLDVKAKLTVKLINKVVYLLHPKMNVKWIDKL